MVDSSTMPSASALLRLTFEVGRARFPIGFASRSLRSTEEIGLPTCANKGIPSF
jgi:hypothetical protein